MTTISARVRAPSGPLTLNVDTVTGRDDRLLTEYLAGAPFATLMRARYWSLTYLDFCPLPTNEEITRLTIQLMPEQVYGPLHLSPHGGQCGAQGGVATTICGAPDGTSIIRGVGGVPAVGAYYGEILHLQDVGLEADANNGIDVIDGGKVLISGVRFGPCAGAHINIRGAGSMVATQIGGYSIVGGAQYHLTMLAGGNYWRWGRPIDVLCDLSMTGWVSVFGGGLADFRGPPVDFHGHIYAGKPGSARAMGVALQPAGGFPGAGSAFDVGAPADGYLG